MRAPTLSIKETYPIEDMFPSEFWEELRQIAETYEATDEQRAQLVNERETYEPTRVPFRILPPGTDESRRGRIYESSERTIGDTVPIIDPSRVERLRRLRALDASALHIAKLLGNTGYQAVVIKQDNEYRVIADNPEVGNALYMMRGENWAELLAADKTTARNRGAVIIRHAAHTSQERIDEQCLDFLTQPTLQGNNNA